MKSATILLVAWFLAGPMAAGVALADEKAVRRAMEQERRAVEAEMRRQAEYEKKMMENQRRAMQEQAKAEQRYMEAQQKAMREQQKMMENQQKAMEHQQKAAMQHPQGTAQPAQARPAHVTTTATATPVYHATHPYYGHHATHHTDHRAYRNYRTTNQADPETLALLRLKKSLDSVAMGSAVTATHRTAIKKGLMGVVEVPRVPTIASIEALSGHLASGLASRTGSAAQTGPMALSLRAAMNSPMLAGNELVEVMNEHRAALRASKFRPAEITAVMESLKTISNQERAHR